MGELSDMSLLCNVSLVIKAKALKKLLGHHRVAKRPYAGDLDAFIPFGVGYIELPEGIRVEARLTVNEPEKLEIGMDMELVVEKFAER